jgi:hypothetical protein
MTKLIAIFAVVIVLYGGWHLFLYWEKVRDQKETEKKQAAAALVVGDQLPGMPSTFNQSLQAAQAQGAAGLRNWLKTYGRSVQDPRKAWIELDYCVAVSHDDPSEARKVFAQVKERTPATSPVFPRIKQLEQAYH